MAASCVLCKELTLPLAVAALQATAAVFQTHCLLGFDLSMAALVKCSNAFQMFKLAELCADHNNARQAEHPHDNRRRRSHPERRGAQGRRRRPGWRLCGACTERRGKEYFWRWRRSAGRPAGRQEVNEGVHVAIAARSLEDVQDFLALRHNSLLFCSWGSWCGRACIGLPAQTDLRRAMDGTKRRNKSCQARFSLRMHAGLETATTRRTIGELEEI